MRRPSLSAALAKLADHHTERPIELWCEGKFMCRIKPFVEGESSFWRLS